MAAKQPPPLMKKHSQTDLVSRLKTRKILGVGGEDDDGEVHRSKVGPVVRMSCVLIVNLLGYQLLCKHYLIFLLASGDGVSVINPFYR
uniref:Tumor protein p53-inducible protein 11 n=1 Tax=Sus scrofa TaxID=9823 RepID=A0A8D0X1M8_PIG